MSIHSSGISSTSSNVGTTHLLYNKCMIKCCLKQKMNKRKYIEWLNRHEAEKNREKQNKTQNRLKNNEPSVLMHHAWALGRATDKQGIVRIIKHQDANTWPMRTDWVKEACLAWRKQSFGETNHSPPAPARRLQGKQSLVPKVFHGGTQRQYT